MNDKKVNINEKIKFRKVLDKSTVLELANDLLYGKTLCISFEDCEKNQAQDILSFLSGVNYATDGNVVTIAKNTFLIGTKENLRDPQIKDFVKKYGR